MERNSERREKNNNIYIKTVVETELDVGYHHVTLGISGALNYF